MNSPRSVSMTRQALMERSGPPARGTPGCTHPPPASLSTSGRLLGLIHRDVPVPDSGIPPECVLATRDAFKDNVRPSNAGRRFWELQGFASPKAERLAGFSMSTPSAGIFFVRDPDGYRIEFIERS
jgi:catechol 2,3-dioxygenase-like lactoylglutathione lyase family enzyme